MVVIILINNLRKITLECFNKDRSCNNLFSEHHILPDWLLIEDTLQILMAKMKVHFWFLKAHTISYRPNENTFFFNSKSS